MYVWAFFNFSEPTTARLQDEVTGILFSLGLHSNTNLPKFSHLLMIMQFFSRQGFIFLVLQGLLAAHYKLNID